MNTISAESISALQSGLLQQQISISVLGKIHDAAQQQADAALQLLDSVVDLQGRDRGSNDHGLDLIV